MNEKMILSLVLGITFIILSRVPHILRNEWDWRMRLRSSGKDEQRLILERIEELEESNTLLADASVSMGKLVLFFEQNPYANYSDARAQDLLLEFIGAYMLYSNSLKGDIGKPLLPIGNWLDLVEDWRR
ncbi:MAG: hypothetical protein WDZ88_04365 [Candidatus Paceibacterota bacterium]